VELARLVSCVLPIFAGLAGVAGAGCTKGKASQTDPPPKDEVAARPSTSTSASVEPKKPVCEPLKVELPEIIHTDIDVEPPAIVDPDDTLAPFYARLATLLRGKAKDHVRIGVYGDSNMTMDYMTGEMRRVLQMKYGDAGHGFVAGGRPWGWYLHQDVRHDAFGPWTAFDCSTDKSSDAIYGFANIAMESKSIGAKSWIETASDKHPIGRSFSRFEVFALERPAGGSFDVKLDDKVIDTVDTKADKVNAVFRKYQTEDGPHRIEIATKSAMVRFFGTVIEREPPSIVVDSLGVGALNCEQMWWVNVPIFQQTLARRGYDLIIDLTGTNMFSPDLHPKWMKNVVEMHRGAIPGVPIILFSPPDLTHWSETWRSDPRVVQIGKQKKEVALANKAAFWDFRAAMGGEASIIAFQKKKMAQSDLVHLTESGGYYMGGRIAFVLFRDFQTWLEKHPTAGCD
jgi:hypothetical protein